ncbi:MAG: general secretion pathway protein GspK [Chromatiales bacterium]|nr:general secretion pathway protein GspK [Chromatiales bacterium]
MLSPDHKSSGIALITVMIVVAAVSATASWLLYSQNLDTTRMARVLEKEQAVLLALSLEQIAAGILEEDRQEQGEQGYDYYAALADENTTSTNSFTDDDVSSDNDEDAQEYEHPQQSWSDAEQLAEKIAPLIGRFESIGLKKTKLCIYDLQAILNINNLLDTESLKIPNLQNDNDFFDVRENPRKVGDWYAERFKELYLREDLDLSDAEVIEFLDNIQDWLDDDDDYRSKGAESADYSFAQPPYRTANGPIASINELYLINAFQEFPLKSVGQPDNSDFELGMDRILTYVVALPTDAPYRRRININTAPLAVLTTLPYISASSAEDLYRDIRETPLPNRKAIDNLLKEYISDEEKRWWHKAYLDVQSRFFATYIELSIGRGQSRTTTRMQSLFYREALESPYKVYVLERHYVGYNPYEIMAEKMNLNNCYNDEKHS